MILIRISILLMCCVFCLGQETGARYLIITHDDYYDAVQALANWKTQKGVKTKVVRLSDIGSDSTQIRNYVVTAYNTWQIKPEYLLLVGNKYQIPFPRRAGIVVCHTDNYYTNVSDDFHNEIIPGRFWVSDTIEAMTFVAKVLSYEKDPFLEDSLWYRKGTIIIEETYDSLPGDSTYWESAWYTIDLMQKADFVHIDLFCDVFGHTNVDVINAINDGRSYITFRGSGVGEWYQPFNNIHPEQMNNGRMLPIVVSATCATVEGIGVEWTCAGTPSEPKGMVGFFGNTTNLDSVSAQRGALLKGTMESVFWDSMSTLGKAAESGRIEYVEQFNDSLEYDSWTCLGDPEMTVWTTTPRNIEVTHDTLLYAGLCTTYVTVQRNSLPAESALVCMMAKHDTSAYVYGYTDNTGSVVLIDTFNQPGDSVTITVTGRNLRPYYDYIKVNYSGGPYVLLNSFTILDSAGGNGDFLANPGEDIEIPVWLKNWGDSTAYNVSATLQKAHDDSFFTLSDTIKYFGDIPGLDSGYSSLDGFNVLVSPQCPDTYPIELNLTIVDAYNATWTSDFSFITHAPILSLNDYYFPGYLKSTPAGDTNALTIVLKNCGSYQAEDVTGIILSTDSFFINIDSSASFGTIANDSTGSNELDPFIIATDPSAPRCYPLQISCIVQAGVYSDTFQFTIYVGVKDFIIWDPDPNHSSGPVIKAQLDSLDYYGDYMTTFPIDDLSVSKSLFICCGVYPNNYVIRDTSRAAQDIGYYITSQSGNVYLEGGDVWVGDPQGNHGYNFCPLFDISPVSNTIGLFPGVTGISGTFTEGMLFDYQGEATMIDNVDSTNGSAVIFRNTHNNNGCGVASRGKTIGLSFEFGGLVDTTLSTKRVLIDSIMHYFKIPPTGIKENQEDQIGSIPFFSVYPNPCFGWARIMYIIDPSSSKGIMLKIFDVSGRLIRQIELPVYDTPSPNCFHWDGKDAHQRKVSCGVYFMSLEIGDFSKTEKVVLLR